MEQFITSNHLETWSSLVYEDGPFSLIEQQLAELDEWLADVRLELEALDEAGALLDVRPH